jgi:hypothetical protein
MKVASKTVVATLAGVALGVGASAFLGAVRSPQASAGTTLTPAQWQRRYLDDLQHEQRDPVWADAASAAIRAWLANNPGDAKRPLRARARALECRKRSCVVWLTWDRRGDAEEEFQRLLSAAASRLTGCTTHLYLEPSEASPYGAPLILTGCD